MKRVYRRIIITGTILIGLWLIFEGAARLFAEVLWFEEVDYLDTFTIRRTSQFCLWLFAAIVSGLFVGINLRWADRWGWQWLPKDDWYDVGVPYLPQQKLATNSSNSKLALGKELKPRIYPDRQISSPRLKLPLLLLATIALSISLIAILFHYTGMALTVWQISDRLPKIALSLQPALEGVDLNAFFWQNLEIIIVVAAIVNFLLLKPQTTINITAILISAVFGFVTAGNWSNILQFFNPTGFNYLDPQFNKDIGFYIFRLPLWQLIETWALGLSSITLIACSLSYLLSGNSLSEGRFPGFDKRQMRHLSFLGGIVAIALAIQHWLNRFELLYSSRGVVYGAGYTNIKVQLPIEICLTVISLFGAFWLFYKGFVGYKSRSIQKRKFQKIIFFFLPFTIYFLIFCFSNLFSTTIQTLVVQPNELVKEKPYIERSITMTRRAFNLDNIEVQTFNPTGQLTAQDLQNNDSTIKNIRLWDTRPILQTNRQLQQIRPYYQFHDADIDRYLLSKDGTVVNGDKQQVIIAARELDYAQVVDIAKTWVNEHLIYTHGYGFTLSPVNRVVEGGLPYYYVKDIGAENKESGGMTVSDEIVRNSIPIGNPRIYYGELTNPYIMTSTKVRELDFPSGEENVYTVYDGTGGIKVGNYFRRILFAEYLKDWQMLFAQNFTTDTKLLFRRNIKKRIKAIAPFLNYDRDPYLVAAKSPNNRQDNLYWIIDAYTTSDRYPYSDPGENDFNYLRNSVKVVVDAYNGKVDFYVADEDPIVQTWAKIFPKLFKPMTAMPLDLRRHIRYPEDLFSIQSERLLTYHMTDPQVFYNREDRWQIPQEIYGTKSQPVAPYYLIMKLPTAQEEEFILLHPYTPTSRPNLIAWLAARSDGAEYGKLLLYKFPKQKLIYGSNQIEALINQDPVISQQISLWNREGSRAIQGNLLIIPIEQSLLYVEPLYIEAEENSLPALARVIVIYENRIVMAETLQEGIDAIFQPTANDSEAIIRPVEDLDPF